MKKLYYIACERYQSRWTEYVSGKTGMFARCVEESHHKVQLETIAMDEDVHMIKSGCVVDTVLRAQFSFWQVTELLKKIESGEINSDSILYFEDFWTGGFEMIPYACHLKKITPKVYAFCHAQSCDPFDFTYEMRHWIRHMERGWAGWLTGIFVAAPELKRMLVDANICEKHKVHVTGTVMNRQYLLDNYDYTISSSKRHPIILFTSRTDPEKNPYFFLEVAKASKELHPDWKFIMLSSRGFTYPLKGEAASAGATTLHVKKDRYFQYLCQASVMLNTASQDFVSYGLLDALAFGCMPLLPRYLTFPAAVGYNADLLYEKGNVEDCIDKLEKLVANQTANYSYTRNEPVPTIYASYGTKYENSVNRMLDVMLKEETLEKLLEKKA